MSLFFELTMTPPRVTKQMRKAIPRTINGKRIVLFVDTPELKDATRQYWELLIPFVPPEPLDGPLLLTLFWHFAPNLAGAQDRTAWMSTSPDLDNMEKLILDVMTKMEFIANDSRIALKLTGKTHNPSWQGVRGRIEPLGRLAMPSECIIDCRKEMFSE